MGGTVSALGVLSMRRLLVCVVALLLGYSVMIAGTDPSAAVVPGGVGRIAFASTMDDLNGDIYIRDFSGGGLVRFTTDTAIDGDPAWSPDGSSVAFTSNRNLNDDVFVMNVDRTGLNNLTSNQPDDRRPAWSPDGSKIAFESNRNGNWEVYVMNADGGNPKNLSDNAAWDGEPAWSPDGSKVAFTSDRGGNYDIYVMNLGGTGRVNLSNSPSVEEQPAWSPDGSKIAFTSNRDGNEEIYVMSADGTDQTRLTNDPGWDNQPAWSPDGSKIAFTSTRDVGNSDIFVVNPDGSGIGHLTDSSGHDYSVDWESVNRLPSAVDDGPYEVQYSGVLNGASVLANDTDPDGEALVAQALSAPDHALVFTLNSDGTFVYRHHDASFSTSDSFTYQALDTRSGVSNVATVSITIVPGSSPTFGLDTVGLVDPSSGLWHLHDGVEVVTSFYFGNSGDYPFVGDWDCGGRVTPGLYRQSDGFAYLRNSITQGNADLTFFFGNPGDVPIAGDFNADGCDTLSIYRPSNQRFYIINELGQDGGGLGAADYEFLFGNPGDTPVVGDWDGDGVDEIGLYRESSGFFYFRNTLTTGVADGQFYFGNPGDRFVAGDWGVVDGRETPGLFRPSNQTFYFRYTLTQGNADAEFTWTGAATDWLPVAGNFNLD
jgi:Tol biopolymer transport system component